jgi:tRNA pseudouridine32 synthase/23S rRNA pseudouridine746 synthase
VIAGGEDQLPDAAGRSLRILYLDDDLVVVDKPAGMPSVPARTCHDPADVATVLERGPLVGTARPEAVHRLDRDTSGVLILARTAAARSALGRAFEGGGVEKLYRAFVTGRLPKAEGVIHLPLAPDPETPPRQRVDPILGRAATSRYVRVISPGLPDGIGAVDLIPVTGRSHQLRVHLAWLGCPILGDRLYGPRGSSSRRLWLHAARITFPHPRDGRPVTVGSPLCTDF